MHPSAPQLDPYYSWQTRVLSVRARQFTIVTKTGVAGYDRPDVASLLLAENIKLDQSDLVAIFNSGDGLVGAVAAATAGQVELTDSHLPSVHASRRTLEANRLANGRVSLSSCLSHIKLDRSADAVAARLPKGKVRALLCIWDAFTALRPGGRFYLAGANKEGIRTYLRHTNDLFGNVSVLAYRKGHRVGVAVKGAAPPTLPESFTSEWMSHDNFRQLVIQARGRSYTVCTRPGVFSWDRLDPGTQMLLESVELKPSHSVLDMGCGYGIIGLVCADMVPQGRVYMVDSDVIAIEAARRTVALSGASNCELLASDCGSAVEHLRFDTVATNPPFHQGTATERQIARQFVQDAARLLKPGGQLYLVANRFLPYEADLLRVFGNATTLTEDSRYKVLVAVRRKWDTPAEQEIPIE